ncbi:MAG: recombination mediator RecR [Planctomycetaceae bacterium]|jgi:recombination protein RecR|nr:recombination mediator RecR [Planctomycetaceae bacterium]
MAELTESVNRLIEELAKLPGIGKKSAERMTYHLLKVTKEEAFELVNAIRAIKEKVRYCSVCFNLAEEEFCEICRDVRRDTKTICVVEQPRDLIALEATGAYHGLYHVLLGRLAPLERITSEHLTIEPLLQRLKSGNFDELIMGTNPTVEGDGTALYITNQLIELGINVRVTRLARGITTGSVLEFANKEMLSDALSGRQKIR